MVFYREGRFVGGTCGSIHVESFNRIMNALGVLENTWDPIRKKLVRRLLEEQDKVLRSNSPTSHKREGCGAKGGDRGNGKGRENVGHVCVKMARADHDQVTKHSLIKGGAWKLGVFFLSINFFGLVGFV